MISKIKSNQRIQVWFYSRPEVPEGDPWERVREGVLERTRRGWVRPLILGAIRGACYES